MTSVVPITATKKTWALQAAEKLILGHALYQGMTSVVPIKAIKKTWALAPAAIFEITL